MKICYLNHDRIETTGTGRFCSFLMGAMRRMAPGDSYRVFTHDDLLPRKFFKLFFSLISLRRSLSEYDVIHALDGWPYGVIAALALLGLKKKLVITAIGTGAVQPLYNFFKKPFLVWTYRRADAVTAVSRNTKNEILKVIPNLHIEVVNHGVDFEKFQKPSRRYEEIENLRPYILSVGAWKPRKGFEYSLAAFKETRREFPNLKYVIVSSGPENKNIERVKFFDKASEDFLTALYKSAELFILLPQDVNKDIEGFGLAFLEAAAAGLPIIATKDSSAEDAVRDGKNGILVAPRNYQDAAAALERILSDRKLRQNMSEESVKFAREMSWEKAAGLYKTIYRFFNT